MLQERGQELSRSTAFGTARLSDVLSHHEIGNPSALFPTMELVKTWSHLYCPSSFWLTLANKLFQSFLFNSISLTSCSFSYRFTRYGCTICLPLRETIEESAKRRHLWQYWAKRGAARCPECNADSSIGSRGCKQIGLQCRVWGRYRTLFAKYRQLQNSTVVFWPLV